jgi:hypothetical protein
MINRTKRDLKTKIYLFTALVIIGGALPATLSIAANAAPPGGMWQDHKGWAFGPIASIQNDKDGKPAWVLSGHWVTNIINKTKESFNQTNPAKFDAWITMVMLNGSAMHKHRISNFSLTDASTQDKTSTYKGTVTITMKDGPVADVPVEIKVMDNHVVTISLDGAKTKNHFGNTPIYGTVLTREDLAMMKGMMSGKGNMTMMMGGKNSSSGSW